MTKRKIFLDGGRYASCEVDNYGNIDVYLFSSVVDLKEVSDTMKENGFCVKNVCEDEASLVIDREKFSFKGEKYTLNQCSDIFEWFGESQVYDFTYYYDKVVFHAPKSFHTFYAAYIEDMNNYIEI